MLFFFVRFTLDKAKLATTQNVIMIRCSKWLAKLNEKWEDEWKGVDRVWMRHQRTNKVFIHLGLKVQVHDLLGNT